MSTNPVLCLFVGGAVLVAAGCGPRKQPLSSNDTRLGAKSRQEGDSAVTTQTISWERGDGVQGGTVPFRGKTDTSWFIPPKPIDKAAAIAVANACLKRIGLPAEEPIEARFSEQIGSPSQWFCSYGKDADGRLIFVEVDALSGTVLNVRDYRQATGRLGADSERAMSNAQKVALQAATKFLGRAPNGAPSVSRANSEMGGPAWSVRFGSEQFPDVSVVVDALATRFLWINNRAGYDRCWYNYCNVKHRQKQNAGESVKPYVWVSERTKDETREGQISVSTAVCAARDFLKRLDMPIQNSVPIVQDESFGFLGPRVGVQFNPPTRVTVSLRDGSISMFMNHQLDNEISHKIGRTGKKRFTSIADAKAYLDQMAAKIGMPPGAHMIRISPTAFDAVNRGGNERGEIAAEFGFEDRGLHVPGNYMGLTLDAQGGALKQMSAMWRPYEIETSVAKLTAAQALSITDPIAKEKQLGKMRCICTEHQPAAKPPRLFYTVRRKKDGNPEGVDTGPLKVRIAWNCNYGYDSVIIDAVTGEVLAVNMVR